MKKGLFEVFGDGDLGLKADDLNEFSKVIYDAGSVIPGGFVIATDIFDVLFKIVDSNEDTDYEIVEDLDCPDLVTNINNAILDKMEIGKPYAIRSSALSERGGTGMYKSDFFMPTGNRDDDLSMLWCSEALVYASEFRLNAKLWRKKSGLPIGMAILIQPIVGISFKNGFFPPLSGIAYTSYKGLPMVQVTVGLGTKSVEGEGIVFNSHVKSKKNFYHDLCSQAKADAFTDNGIEQVSWQCKEVKKKIDEGFKSFNRFINFLSEVKKQEDFYFEWAIYDDTIYILQCAKYVDRSVGDIPFDSRDYIHLAHSKDVVNSGRASCKKIVFAYHWNKKTADNLESLNLSLKDYLLIINDKALSQLSVIGRDENGEKNEKLSLRHFSNSLAIVEQQTSISIEKKKLFMNMNVFFADHSCGQGASHFTQLCNRTDILFVGAQFDKSILFRIPSGISYGGENSCIIVLDIDSEVLVDGIKKEANVYISKKVKKQSYMLHEIRGYSMFLRECANALEGRGNTDLAGSFYAVHYAIGDEDSSGPYYLEEEIVNECGGPKAMISNISDVFEHGQHYNGWNEDLACYLRDLGLYLETRVA